VKKFIIPLMTVAVVVSIVFAGCAQPTPTPTPEPAPAPEQITAKDIPELQSLIASGAVDPDLPLNPFGEDFAVKPDGTPYVIAGSYLFLGVDGLSQGAKLQKSLVERAGGEYIDFDPAMDAQEQIGYLENLATAIKPDCLVIQTVNENLLIPAVDKVVAAGIPVITWDITAFTDSITSFIQHDFDGPQGSCIVGQYYVDRAQSEGRTFHVFEIWGQRAMQTSVDRHNGFRTPIDLHPELVTVTESLDSNWSAEICANLVMDAFTADPTLDAIFQHGGGLAGTVEGLRSIDRLLPVDDPGHVVMANNDIDTALIEAMKEGNIEVTGSHCSPELQDTAIQAAFTYVILGQAIPNPINLPMYLMTPENVESLSILGLPIYTELPKGQWDLWPALDCTEVGVPPPTKALRMQYKGY